MHKGRQEILIYFYFKCHCQVDYSFKICISCGFCFLSCCLKRTGMRGVVVRKLFQQHTAILHDLDHPVNNSFTHWIKLANTSEEILPQMALCCYNIGSCFLLRMLSTAHSSAHVCPDGNAGSG